MNGEIELNTKLVGEIEGNFFVPSYQRGYRWGEAEVTRLLDDIYATEGKRNYCLQPIVVLSKNDKYELIDGQQRLTTIYLIYRYMHDDNGKDEPKFSISYQTREKSEEFLKKIDINRKDENIDFYFMSNAYNKIQKWFDSKKKENKNVINNIIDYFQKTVKIIWYKVNKNEEAIPLFTRLNIGKISLTNAELVKALFLSKYSFKNINKESPKEFCSQWNDIEIILKLTSDEKEYKEKQEEIALQWDNIERELHNDSFWYFLTNKTNYQTRIDLVLDLISNLDNKTENARDIYHTFFKFDEMRKNKSLEEIWKEIQHTFLILKDWFEDHELYHKIGYLIASNSETLQKIFELSKGKKKNELKDELNERIKASISFEKSIADLNYKDDPKEIYKLLLLFNVESVRQSAEQTQRFPFDKFKVDKNGKVIWSLEHIHAQQSEGMKTQKEWKEWLNLHIPSVKVFSPNSDNLVNEMEKATEKLNLSREEFNTIQKEVIELLSPKGDLEYLHSISNMALLNTRNNSTLSNSTFDVKRNEIIEMDKKGEYIPFCTRMVFLKYYTPSEGNQLHFWGEIDREAYINAMNNVLLNDKVKYLCEKIELKRGENK